MYLNNNNKFSDVDRYVEVNTSNKNTIENFTQVNNWEATFASIYNKLVKNVVKQDN